jgi:hypothetical protein
MFIYLNESYPNVYIYRCKFGDVLYDGLGQMTIGRHASRSDIAKKLTTLFSCDELDSYDVYDSWSASRPVYVGIKNATNENVLVPYESETQLTIS